MLRREQPHVRSIDDTALFSYDIVCVDFRRVMGKAEVSSNFFLVLLRLSWILPGSLESVFDRIIEVMHEDMDNIIRFDKKSSLGRLDVKIGGFQCSCIVGVAEPINEIGKQSFRNTLLDTIFIV